jgi:hypothetical protein
LQRGRHIRFMLVTAFRQNQGVKPVGVALSESLNGDEGQKDRRYLEDGFHDSLFG